MAAASSAARRVPNREAALKSLYDDVSAKNMFPFWATSRDVAHDEIKQLMGTERAVPFVWRCAEDIEPILNRAVELITMDDSERRSLILVNPGLAPRRATVSTMYTAYRLTMPTKSCRRTSIRRARFASVSRARAISLGSTARTSCSAPATWC